MKKEKKINNLKFALSFTLSSIAPNIKKKPQESKNIFNSKLVEKNSIFVISNTLSNKKIKKNNVKIKIPPAEDVFRS